ncbi:hypothetical protein FHR32_002895 [Streptosporangium album]|uniref:DUF2637 domain-containing protein n=1 Tax=Streptosporangium album TaxID=47479 RepID=A0A7W7RUT4_9ACTN|nr:hypothetical protein [Streptosporangium album]MBB4938590.1 hypothetical protein [Streptosporangium album]
MSAAVMTRAEVLAELEGLQRTSRNVNRAVWGVAVGVMVYGAGNVTGLLIAHGVHPAIAWMLSPMVDLGLIVALMGGRALDRYGVRAGWLTMLRWTAGLMTWSLNIAGPALAPGGVDTVGVLIHSCGPVLLLVVAEAAASVQRGIAATTDRLTRQLTDAAQPAPAPIPTASGPSALPPTPAPDRTPKAVGSAKPRTSKSSPASRTRRTAAPADVDELMPLGWRIAADHESRGITLTRDRLKDAVRQSGQSISTDRAGRLLTRLRTDPPADPAPTTADPADQQSGSTATTSTAPTVLTADLGDIHA